MLIATLGGALAALGPLVVLMAVGIIGWFATDAGVHGAPRDGMRVGALAWLAGHGSGVTVMGARVTIVPLAVTAIAAWSMWRLGHRVGDSVSGHGPDADRISDGERDLTVPTVDRSSSWPATPWWPWSWRPWPPARPPTLPCRA